MTYQDVVNRIQQVVNDHLMLADFGYGDISDLKTRFENVSGDSAVQADYPYAFLNPASHSRTQNNITYNFNLIVMDMARGEVQDQPYNNMLAIQSQCQQYIDDIIARLYYFYKDQPQVLFGNLTYTPFNERFQDDVAGMTVNLQIQVPNAIDACVAPFTPVEPVSNLIYDMTYDGGYGTFAQLSDVFNLQRSGGPQYTNTDYIGLVGDTASFQILQAGTYKFNFTFTGRNLITQSQIDTAKAGGAWTDPDGKIWLKNFGGFPTPATYYDGLSLPFDETTGVEYTLNHEFTVSLDPQEYYYEWKANPYTEAIATVAQYKYFRLTIELA